MPHQVSVFAENRPGKIERITGVLLKKNIDIRAITISDSGDYGIVKLLVDRPQEAADLLKEEGIAATLRDIVAIRVKDKPGGLYEAASILTRSGVNVEDAYGFIVERKKDAVFVFQVEDVRKTERVLSDAGFSILTDGELYLI
ncbi:MAG TPA: ACT domain-containing protein [Spirochaetota bacterium]|nr:ACT domain-containing protein [Spirochaetota bacterium]HNU90770.1 ACT domain-containing protein [Spirochaetota bacterium]HPV98904.1 ACT domain-containing protein [Spirochaetota bacterium]